MKRTILYVDDEAENRVVFEASLDDRFRVLTAADVDEALAMLARESVPVVVSDQRMPGRTGVDLFSIIRARYPQTRRILLTAYTEPRAMIDAINHGQIYYFLQKPWDRSSIESVLVRAIEAYDLAIALEQQSTVLTRQNDELRAMQAHLEQASRLKSEFLANVSHEIRTPMTAILGFADLLRDRLSSEEDLETIDTIQRNGEYLLEIINDILDLSKIEADSLQVEQQPCSPREVVREVAQLMRPRCESKGLWLDVAIDESVPPQVPSDALRLRQILLNLVGNAVKFTERGGVRVGVRIEPCETMTWCLHFDVVDSGIGIPAERLKALFQPFSQLDSSMTRRFGGTGLGLAISRRLAQLLGGDIAVQSVPGQGSTFSLILATSRCPSPAVAGREPAGELATDDRDENTAGALARPANRTLSGKFLLAEDGLDNQRLLSLILRNAGAELTIVDNGRSAVEEALKPAEVPYDLVLMDMHMPQLDGYEATAQLRRLGYRRPIVAVTAHAMTGDRQRCLEAGCDEVVTKPFDRRRLLQTISRCLGAEFRAPVTVESGL
ncbi:MAG TPA: response regulator [Pirellulales bacterium]|jgi:signal transduction histidine kinase|nr:response regulator [Pirellulales bacterium]